MSRIELAGNGKKIEPRRFVSKVTIGIETAGYNANWMDVGSDAQWYYAVYIGGEDAVYLESTVATVSAALAILDTYADMTDLTALRVRDKMILSADPGEVVAEEKRDAEPT